MNPKTRKLLIIAAIVVAVLVFLVIQSCTIRTPEIHGVALDAETEEPVADAWIRASIGTRTRTIQGDVGGVISLAPPHLRTGEDGTFVIPSRRIAKTPFPLGFGTKVDEFSVHAVTTNRSGSAELDTKGWLWKRKMDLTIHMKDVEQAVEEFLKNVPPERLEEAKEQSSFSGLQGLYRYCMSGRAGIENSIEKSDGCDDWELEFTIKKHEMYLERYGDDSEHAGGVLKQLGYLSKKKKSYIEAIEFFNRTLAYDKERNIRFRKKEIENQIDELEQLVQEGKRGDK